VGYSCLTPACAGLLELMESKLGLLKSTFNAENFIRRLSGSIFILAISAQFFLKICIAARNHEKFTITRNLGVQGRSRLSMLIKLKSTWPVLVTISNMSVPICNRFTLEEPIAAKWRLLRGYFHWRWRSKGIPSPRSTKFRHDKLDCVSKTFLTFFTVT